MSIFGGVINTSEIYKTSSWLNYTPKVLSANGIGTINTSLAKGKYITVGKLVFVSMQIIISSTVGGVNTPAISLPLAPDFLSSFPNISGILNGSNVSLNTKWISIGPIYVEVLKYDGTSVASAGNELDLAGVYVRLQ